MEGLDLGQTSNPSLAWKKDVFKINDDEDDMLKFNKSEDIRKVWSVTTLKNVNLDKLIPQPGCKKVLIFKRIGRVQ